MRSDGLWWDGAAFVAEEQWVDAEPGGGTLDPVVSFDFTIPVGAVDGDVFNCQLRANGDDATIYGFGLQVRSAGGGGGGEMIAHDHTGAFVWDLPIERPDD